MDFEELIIWSNKQYKMINKAVISKIATPIKPVEYDKENKKITKAYFEKKSTVDFLGVFEGRAIAFEAKKTNAKKRLDLSNVKKHQYQFLEDWYNCGGISFLLINFEKRSEIYCLPFKVLREYWLNKFKGGRKSIPLGKINFKVESESNIILDYLEVIEKNIDKF